MKPLSSIMCFLRKFRIYFRRMCRQLTIPGFNYIMDSAIPIWQRSTLGLLMLCITGVTVSSMVQAYKYSRDHFIVTNIETLQFPLWNLTYPAVYICNLNRISLKNLHSVLDRWVLPNNMTRKEAIKELKALPALAFKMKMTENYNIIHKILTMNNVSFSLLMDQLSDSCNEYLKACKWWKRFYLCDQLFTKVVSVDGFCCAFNAYPYYALQQKKFRKAKIATSCSYSDNLIVTLKINQSDYFSSLSSSYGFAVYLKNPYLYPDSSDIGKLIPVNMVTLISFLAKKLFSTDGVKELPEELRGCSPSYRYLPAFQQYSYHNCLVTCRVNLTVHLCKCVPLIYPFTSGNQRRCEISDMPCLHYYSDVLQAVNHGIVPEQKGGQHVMKHIKLKEKDDLKNRPCNCLPECSRTYYEADAVYSPLVQYKKYIQNESGTNVQLYIYAQDIISTRIRRDTYYTWSVLLGTYGGLLGFFLGLSIICFSELFYVFVLHPTFVLVKTFFFNYNSEMRNIIGSDLSIGPSVFIVDDESFDAKHQTNVERYNNRLKRIMKYKNARVTFHQDLNQECN